MTTPRCRIVTDAAASAAVLATVLPDDCIADVLLYAAAETDALAAAALEEVAADDVIVVGADQRSRDLAGSLSIALDIPLVWSIDTVHFGSDGSIDVSRPLGGSHRVRQHIGVGGAIVSVKVAGQPDTVQRDLPATNLHVQESSGVSVVGRTDLATTGPSLSGAKHIVSVGRGIGGPENLPRYRELAECAKAALGASRVAVDSGWIPFGHQVGQTGTSVAPDLYVAFGISGAVQHLAGMRSSKRVVAVNTDPEAPICQIADLVVVADANEVADRLLDRFSTHTRPV